MALRTTAELVAQAAADRYGILAFNIVTLEHAEAVLIGAEAAGRPVILQLSQNAVRFHGGRLHPLAAAARLMAQSSDTAVALHLDHVQDEHLLRQAGDAGFSSVMYDAGAFGYDENVARTSAAVEWAHGCGLWVEAELGYVGGKPDAPANAHAAGVRTDPEEAREFVARTGVDALAVAVGSSHAMTSRSAALDKDLIARLREAVAVPLVLHGSSGVPDDELRHAVDAGMVKVNVGTALGMAFTGAVRTVLAADEALVDPRTYLGAAREAMAGVVENLMAVLYGATPD